MRPASYSKIKAIAFRWAGWLKINDVLWKKKFRELALVRPGKAKNCSLVFCCFIAFQSPARSKTKDIYRAPNSFSRRLLRLSDWMNRRCNPLRRKGYGGARSLSLTILSSLQTGNNIGNCCWKSQQPRSGYLLALTLQAKLLRSDQGIIRDRCRILRC